MLFFGVFGFGSHQSVKTLIPLPEYFNNDYPTFKEISRLLMDGRTIFLPQRNGLGEVDGKCHLQIHDKQTQETMKHLDTAKQTLADSLTRTEQQPKKEAPVMGGGLK